VFGTIGVPELLLILMFSALWLVPIAAAIWALVTLRRVRATQLEMQDRLVAIDQLLQHR
jgi:hypothetical protein